MGSMGASLEKAWRDDAVSGDNAEGRKSDDLDLLEQGVVIWSPEGEVIRATPRANDSLELGYHPLKPGVKLDEFLARCVKVGGIEPQMRDMVLASFELEEAFSYTQTTDSDAVILVSMRRTADGRRIATTTNITEFQESSAALAAAKRRAEEIETEMSMELSRLKAEKRAVELRQAELKRLSLVAAHAKDLIVITDQAYRIVWANEAFRRRNGLDLEMDLVGRSNRDVLIGSETDPAALTTVDEAVRNRQSVTVELVCHAKDGSAYWMEQEIIPVFGEDGAHTNFIVVGRDVSERKAAEEAQVEAQRFEIQKQSEWKLLSEFNEWLQSSDTLEEVFAVVSAFLERLLPRSIGAVYTYAGSRDVLERACQWGPANLLDNFTPSDCWALRRGRAFLYGENVVDIPCSHLPQELVMRRNFCNICAPIIAHGETVGLLSVSVDPSDIQESRKLAIFCAEHISLSLANVRMREQLRDQSMRDPLTGLHNRRFFLDFARRELPRCGVTNTPASLLALDVDHFKRFNDQYGHEAGDLVLTSLAQLLKTLFSDGEAPCRIGGEEFVVLIPGADEETAMTRAEVLRGAIERMEVAYNGQRLNVTSSIGVSVYPHKGESIEALTRAADQALYVAKGAGRNCVRLAE